MPDVRSSRRSKPRTTICPTGMWRCCAVPATTAATASSSRARCTSVASTCRCSSSRRWRPSKGDARLNVEILGRLGLTVVEISDEQAWDLHFSEISQCDLIVDAIFGTGLKSPLAGMMETVAADVNASGIPVIAIDLPSGLSADHAEPIGECIHAGMTVTLAAPKLPLVLPPGEAHAGNIVVADIGIPPEVIDNLAGPAPRAADARGDARDHSAARVGFAQGRLRARAGHCRLAGQDRRRTPGGHRRAAVRRGTRQRRNAASSQPIVAAMGAEYMTVPLEETADGTVALGGARGGSRVRAGRHCRRPGPRHGSRRHGVRSGARREEREPARARRRCAERAGVRSRSAAGQRRRVASDHHHAASGRDGPARQYVGRRGAGEPPRRRARLRRAASDLRRAEGVSHAHRHAGRQGVHQPAGQSRHGDRRHRRCADRRACRVAGAAARRRSGVQDCASTCTRSPAISPKPTRAKWR